MLLSFIEKFKQSLSLNWEVSVPFVFSKGPGTSPVVFFVSYWVAVVPVTWRCNVLLAKELVIQIQYRIEIWLRGLMKLTS